MEDLDLSDLPDEEDLPGLAEAPPMVLPRDPALLGYPPMLPVELALHDRPVQEVCASYGVDIERWRALTMDQVFVEDLKARVLELKRDGMSFRLKARLQAEHLLNKSWQIIHDPRTPFAVKADLIKHTVRVAGYDASKDQGIGVQQNAALQIVLNLGEK